MLSRWPDPSIERWSKIPEVNMTIIGIDLGTSNSAAAVLRGGRPVMIPSAEGITLGGKAFPSYVAVTADGQMPARLSRLTNEPWKRSGK